ncbi:POK9 protein, partial [Nothocercus julius]|nr:POK9 protein [Nothocercus julius]
GGSAGLDLATSRDETLNDTQVMLIPTGVFGPLGKKRQALLLGCSSTTRMGLFVLPGVIDADCTGEIQIMAWTPVPPCYIPEGQPIAQLVPFLSPPMQGPEQKRGSQSFGSTGKPQIFWTQQIVQQKPLLTWLVDTGAVSIVR